MHEEALEGETYYRFDSGITSEMLVKTMASATPRPPPSNMMAPEPQMALRGICRHLQQMKRK